MKEKTLIFFLLKLSKIPLTLLTLSLTAHFFGVSIDKDIWLLAYSILQTLDLAVWGPLNETFRTKFITLSESEGETLALQKASSLLLYIFIGSLLMVVTVEVFSYHIASIIASKYDTNRLMMLSSMIKWIAPWLLINQFILIGTSILNSYEIFYVPEISSFFSQIINILVLIVFGQNLGIKSLIIGLYVSNALLLTFICFYIRKQKIELFKEFSFKFDGFKLYFLFALPFFAPYFLGQLNGSLEKIIALSLGNGAVSIIDFSKKIPDIIVGVLTSMVLSLLAPILTKSFMSKEMDKFNLEFLSSYKLGLFLIGGIIILMVGSCNDITSILYQSKEIAQRDLASITKLTTLYSIGILGIFTYVIFGMSMMATNQAKLYVVCGMTAQILVISGNFFLSKMVGIYAFPASYFLSHLICGFVMYCKYPGNKDKILMTSLRYYGFFMFGSLAVYLVKDLFFLPSKIYQIVAHIVLVCLGVLISAIVFKLEEVNEIKAFIVRKVLKT